MNIITRKIKLIPSGNTVNEKKNTLKYIKNVAETLTEVGNKIIRLHVINFYDIEELINLKNISKKDATTEISKKFNTSLQNAGYRLTQEYNDISSEIRTGFNQTIFKTITNNFYDIKNGKMSIPSFRKNNIKIPISGKKNVNGGTSIIYVDNDNYFINFPLSNNEKKILNQIKFSLLFGKDRSNNKSIVDNCINGTFTISDSSIQIKDNDIFLLLTCKIPTKNTDKTPTNTMGVDLGMNRPVSFFINNLEKQPDQINIGSYIHYGRNKFFIQRKKLQENLKFTKGGHGRNRKLQKLNDLREKEKNWATNTNHKISKELIDIAINNNVKIIKLEDLTGITTNSKDYFLKSWAYYQLQSFIVYKAQQNNITVEWVDPKYTSQTCSTCNETHKDNRNNIDKTKFTCVNLLCDDFGIVKDADVNAAKNICNKISNKIKPNSKEGKKQKKKILEHELSLH